MEPEIVGNRVEKLMKKHNLSKEQLAKQMGLTNKELEIKLNGKEEFFLEEMRKLKEIFKLTPKECDELFFL